MSDNNGNQKQGLSKQIIFLILAVTLILCGTVVAVAFVFLNRQQEPPQPISTSAGSAYVVTEANYLAIEQEVQEKIERGMFQTYMNTTWSFPDGSSASSNAVMGNSSANTYPFYFTVTLNDTGEVVYTSGLLPVGNMMGEIILDEPLDQGTYPAVVNIHMVDENGEPLDSNTGFSITLIIQN